MRLFIAIILYITAATLYGQNNQYDRPAESVTGVTPYKLPYNEMLDALKYKQSVYDTQKEKFDRLYAWVADLSAKQSDEEFKTFIDKLRSTMESIYNNGVDFSELDINNIEPAVRRNIDSYNSRAEKRNNLQVNYNKGYELMKQGNYSEAITYFNNILSQDADFLEAHRGRAFCYYHLKKYSDAIIEVKTIQASASVLKSQDYFCLVWSYLYSNNITEAYNTVLSAITLYPDNYDNYFARAYCKKEMNDTVGAIKDYYKVLQLNPNHSMAYNNLGWTEFERGNLNEALRLVSKSVELNPKNFIAFDSKAEIEFNLKSYTTAIADCNKALDINPANSNSYLTRGRANYKLGHTKDACFDWQKASELENPKASNFINRYCTK